MEFYAGTSGYQYASWRGPFYPGDLPQGAMLSHYASKLNAVELNNTFYRMPRRAVLETWRDAVPPGFRFAVKASRRITHRKRLKDPSPEIAFLLGNLETLGDRLGAILFQLPPDLPRDLPRLESFLRLLPPGTPAAFEFRHRTWMDDAVYAALRARGAALCLADGGTGPEPEPVATADWGYLRLRRAAYTAEDLASWRRRIAGMPWNRVFAFFKHEEDAAGPALAARLRDLENPAAAG
jgi:uncharacterized protein YecE (DUF72 family)